MQPIIAGFGVSLSLIVAIGAQNAFVLRQGILREHVLPVVLFCACTDAILIWAGIVGFGAVTDAAPWALVAMRWAGAAFLFVYGAMNFRSAWRGGASIDVDGAAPTSLGRTMTVLFAMTWLNPHVYLDTVGLIGAVAQGYDGAELAFGVGATMASATFFFTLGYGARLLVPLFRKPRAWQVLDLLIGVVMWTIAVGLLID